MTGTDRGLIVGLKSYFQGIKAWSDLLDAETAFFSSQSPAGRLISGLLKQRDRSKFNGLTGVGVHDETTDFGIAGGHRRGLGMEDLVEGEEEQDNNISHGY